MDRLVEERAVQPHDVFDVVLDFSGVRLVERRLVGRKVAVRDGMIVTRASLVDVLRRQCRRERQEWHDEQQSRGTRQPNHARIMALSILTTR